MSGSYILRSVDKAKATDNLKMNGKGVKNCMANDDDKDGDGVEDVNDSHPYVKTLCADSDNDGCDDCSSGYNDPYNDELRHKNKC